MVLQGINCKKSSIQALEAILNLELEGTCRTMADVHENLDKH
jgi:hypothetical protein